MKVRAEWENARHALHIEAETDEEDKLLNALMSKPNWKPHVWEQPAPSGGSGWPVKRAALAIVFRNAD